MATVQSTQPAQTIQHPQITLVPATVPDLPKGSISRPPIPNKSQSSGKPPTIYVIRHGEKDDPDANAPAGSDGPIGLNALGFDRANSLPLVFNDKARTNPYNIRLILAMQPQPDGQQERPYETIWPLFLSLSQDPNNYCLLDNSVHEEAVQLAARRMKEFIASGSPGNILLCWEHKNLTNILQAFGFAAAPEYPKLFDVVWVLEPSLVQQPSSQLTTQATNGELALNPDDDGKQQKTLWSYNTLTWWSEGTNTDFALDEKPDKWARKENAPSTNQQGEFVTALSGTQSGPTFAWAPYKHHQLDHPKN